MIKQLLKSKEEFDKKFINCFEKDALSSTYYNLREANKIIKKWHIEQQLALIQEIKDWAEGKKIKKGTGLLSVLTTQEYWHNQALEDLLKELDNIKK